MTEQKLTSEQIEEKVKKFCKKYNVPTKFTIHPRLYLIAILNSTKYNNYKTVNKFYTEFNKKNIYKYNIDAIRNIKDYIMQEDLETIEKIYNNSKYLKSKVKQYLKHKKDIEQLDNKLNNL